MSILNCASSASVYRGYDYYVNKHVTDIIKINSSLYEGYVNGNTKNAYYVKIDTEHPRKSYCDCPHATGNTVCKHMVALYFSAFPQEAEDLKGKYTEELYKYFKENFYKKIEEGKQRKIYEDASRYIKAIYKLNQGEMFVNKIIKELQESEYSKRPALFEEIYKTINS